MLAPLTTIGHAASVARQSLRDSLDTAERLAESAQNSEDDSDSPEEARERVEDVYEPLMGRRKAGDSGSRERGGGGTHEHAHAHEHEHEHPHAHAREEGADDEEEEIKVRKLEVYLSYSAFLVLGACILLPWNSEIVASGYLGARLEGSVVEKSFSSWIALTFTGGNLVFLAFANATQHGAKLARRISSSILLMASVLVLFILSTLPDSINPNLFFALLILCTIFLAASASFLQNAVVALSARFGSMYLQGILSGQGAVGLAVAALQFVSAYTAKPSRTAVRSRSTSLVLHTTAIPDATIRDSAFTFFLTVGLFSGFAYLAYALLVRLPLYRLVIRGSADDPDTDPSSLQHKPTNPPPSLWVVERKVRHLGLAIFYIFAVTLSVFPSITSSILSVHDPTTGGEGGLGRTLSAPGLFVPLAFMVFAAGDWIGRAMPQFDSLVFTNWRVLAGASAARTAFVPLFLWCNVQLSGTASTPWINSDAVFLLLMLLFALSNGYISTLIMLAAIVEPSLEPHEIDIAATCLAFYLTAGLAVGSLISFPVRAAVCRCNPFA